METLQLVKNGIFPITKDAHGEVLPKGPATHFSFPGTIQGEGKLAGVPSLFIRLSGCNLRCAWEMPDGTISICDTPESSFDIKSTIRMAILDIEATLMTNRGNINHVVITGGEPMMQAQALGKLCKKLKERDFHLTLETNGTIFEHHGVEWVDLISISPKLSTSTPNEIRVPDWNLTTAQCLYHQRAIAHLDPLQEFLNFRKEHPEKELQLKFVISSINDIKLVHEEVLDHLSGWRDDDILLMPLGGTQAEQRHTEKIAAEAAIKNGWRYSPRLQIELWGHKAGV